MDPCGQFDRPSYYERKGTELSYVIAVTPTEAVDVTRRYSLDWKAVLTRRNVASERGLHNALESLCSDWGGQAFAERRAIECEELIENEVPKGDSQLYREESIRMNLGSASSVIDCGRLFFQLGDAVHITVFDRSRLKRKFTGRDRVELCAVDGSSPAIVLLLPYRCPAPTLEFDHEFLPPYPGRYIARYIASGGDKPVAESAVFFVSPPLWFNQCSLHVATGIGGVVPWGNLLEVIKTFAICQYFYKIYAGDGACT